MSDKNCLILFVRNPEQGKVKTRIAKEIGTKNALIIYTALLEYTIRTVDKLDVEKLVFVADSDEFSLKMKGDVLVFEQQGADLGTRMEHAFRVAFGSGFAKAVIIGSDNFEISTDIIVDAFEKLKANDCVIGPATDGGYYLLGLKKNQSTLFKDIAWSTDKTLTQTIAVIEHEKLSYQTLTPLNDVDTIEDVLKYKELENLIQ